jgi:hypothetical protein
MALQQAKLFSLGMAVYYYQPGHARIRLRGYGDLARG